MSQSAAITERVRRRDSNLELFRIITMLFIIAHHYVVNSGLASPGGAIYSDPVCARSLFLLIFGAFGKTGINCFVLITGYFMCRSHITAKKFTKLFLEIMFYRIAVSAVFWAVGYEPFSLRALVEVIIPIRSVGTGFTNAYLIFFLLIPFLNILLHNMTEKLHIRLLLICSFTYILLGTLPSFSVTMNYVSWFIVLYIIAAYIRMYPKKLFHSIKLWGWMTALSAALSVASVIICAWLSERLGQNAAYYFVTDSNTLLAVLTGLSSFMLFKNIKIRYNPLINAAAASAFGVLMIHASGEAIRRWLWVDFLKNTEMYNSPWLVLHAIGSVLAIYIICAVIDRLRTVLLERPLFKLWDRHSQSASAKLKKAESAICKKLGIGED